MAVFKSVLTLMFMYERLWHSPRTAELIASHEFPHKLKHWSGPGSSGLTAFTSHKAALRKACFPIIAKKLHYEKHPNFPIIKRATVV